MAMNKVIKEFKFEIKENEYTYEIGYNIYAKKVYPKIEIYKNEEFLSGGFWINNLPTGSANFVVYTAFFNNDNDIDVDTIKKMFIELRQYSDVPEEVEQEYEKIFLLYKLNDFKKL
jgi:hypothetical protein